MAEPVMKLYTEATDGSYIETKESALVWHHQDADPGFGSAQAKEMLDHLESVLANEPVSVKSGQHIVEVKPQVLNFSKTHYSAWLKLTLMCGCSRSPHHVQNSVPISVSSLYLTLTRVNLL